jgi:hypothetical protein
MTGTGSAGAAPEWTTFDITNVGLSTELIAEITSNEIPDSDPSKNFVNATDYELTSTDTLIYVLRRMYNHI